MSAGSLLDVRSVTRRYRLPRTALLSPAPVLTAVNEVSLSLKPGECLGIVGESGSGKSTLARMIMGFERPDAGAVHFDGQDINAIAKSHLRRIRPRFQMVFQDPIGSLDPRRTVGWSVAEPLLGDPALDAAARRRRAGEAMEQVRMRPADMGRFPHEFSGGQRQRIAIARAIAPRPALLIGDEPVASLDVSVQAQILNLLMELQEQLNLAIVIIGHDLAVIASLCDRVMVMRGGAIVEQGPVGRILGSPQQEYTRSLLAAAASPF